MFLNNLVPSWSSFLFIFSFFLGIYSFYKFLYQRKKGTIKVSYFLWGSFLVGVSLFFLGNEYHFWSFLTAKTTIIGIVSFFSLALILSTIFIKSRFYRISLWVPAIALLLLSLLAALVFAGIKIFYPPLWSVNFIFIILFITVVFLRLFIKKGKAY